MQYYPQNPQNNPYNNLLAGASYGAPAFNPSMQTIGGNMMPLGYGYNGGYYTGNYGYNPYMEQQRMQIMKAQYEEQQRNQSSYMKRLFTASCSYSGEQATPDQLRQFDPTFVQQNNDLNSLTRDQQREYCQIAQHQNYLQQNQMIINELYGKPYNEWNPLVAMYENGYSKMTAEYTKKLEGVGLVEYLDKYAPQEYIESIERQNKKNQNNVRSNYNYNDYNALLKHHKEGLFGNAFDPNVSIDDQEVRLPTAIYEKSRAERRQAFLRAVGVGGV